MAVKEGLEACVRLEQTAGVGPETARKLLSGFGLPENIFSASYSALQKVVSERVALALTGALSAQTQTLIERTLAWVHQPQPRLDIGRWRPFTIAAGYPPSPLVPYAKGRVEPLSALSLAVVASRNATAQGIANAQKFSEALRHAGFCTVPGMALGLTRRPT